MFNASLLKAVEIRHVETFKGVRNCEDGSQREITIEIHDAGPDIEPNINRYLVFAYDGDGRVMASNASDTIETAIATAQWGRFDVDDYIDPAYTRPKR